MSLFQAITNILTEASIAPNLTHESRELIKQWLSNGQEWNFIHELEQILQVVHEAGISTGRFFTRLSLVSDVMPVPEIPERFFRNVPLPSGLTQEHLQQAMFSTQQMLIQINHHLCHSTNFPLINFIQANNFSGIVSNMLTDALDHVSPYKHNHEQRYPDLKNVENNIGLEVKAANKAGKGGESHNGHGGWHLVACFELDEASGNIQFTHIEITELVSHQDEKDGDWHYCGSTVDGDTGSQRTETYYTTGRGTSKLRDGSVYLDTDRVKNWSAWQHCQLYSIPPYSPLYFQRLQKDMKVPSLKKPEISVRWSGVKSQLNTLDPLWPLYNRTQLAELGLPEELIEVIRPEET